jgi:hypothetical protein
VHEKMKHVQSTTVLLKMWDYILNGSVYEYTVIDVILHLQQYSRRLNLIVFLTRGWVPRTIHLITQYMEHISEWYCWRMFIETWPHFEKMVCDKYREQSALCLPLALLCI